jgi:hypothetical protein
VAVALAVASCSLTAVARADLDADAAALSAAWAKRGARVARQTLFVDQEGVAVSIADKRDARRRCTSIVVVAERQIEFALVVGGPKPARILSRAGVARLRRCSGKRVRKIRLELREGAAAIEVLTVAHGRRLDAPEAILPVRAEGRVERDPEPPAPAPRAPLAERVARAEESARLDGAAAVEATPLHAQPDGSGKLVRELAAGCHRLTLLAEDRVDAELDAEARVGGGALLAGDRGRSAHARLDFCLGEGGRVEVFFDGAPGGDAITLVAARWPLPAELDASFGASVAGAMAHALRERRLHALGPPAFQALGLQGITGLTLGVEPGACYVAAVALAAGDAERLRLGVAAGAAAYYDDAPDPPYAAAVTFCAGPHDESAQLAVDLRADSAAWLAAWWRVGDAVAR